MSDEDSKENKSSGSNSESTESESGTESAENSDSTSDSGEVKKDAAPEGVFKRRSLFKASMESFNYVNSISQDEAVKVRDSDRATSIALLVTSIGTVAAMLIEQAAAHRMPLLVACDVLIGVSILIYLGNRFGILTTFNPRQALLSWQLMMGAAFFGIFLTINLALVLGMFVVATTPVDPTGF